MGRMEARAKLEKHGAEPLRIISIPQPTVSIREVGDGIRARDDTPLRFRQSNRKCAPCGSDHPRMT
jgi:hypothetical protein